MKREAERAICFRMTGRSKANQTQNIFSKIELNNLVTKVCLPVRRLSDAQIEMHAFWENKFIQPDMDIRASFSMGLFFSTHTSIMIDMQNKTVI